MQFEEALLAAIECVSPRGLAGNFLDLPTGKSGVGLSGGVDARISIGPVRGNFEGIAVKIVESSANTLEQSLRVRNQTAIRRGTVQTGVGR